MASPLYQDDSALFEACLAKNAATWSIFTQRYSPLVDISIKNRLAKYGFRLSKQDREDITQTVFLKIWHGQKLGCVKKTESLPPWLAIVSGNEALKYIRDRERGLAGYRQVSSKDEGTELIDLIPSSAPRASDILHERELSKRIGDSLKGLSAKEILIAKLNFLHGKKYHEISKMLNIPPGTVSSYIKRAKKKLKTKLKKYYLLKIFATISAILGSI